MRAALAKARRRRTPPPTIPAAASEWKPACPHCGGTRTVCAAMVLPGGKTIVLPAAARLVLWQTRAPP